MEWQVCALLAVINFIGSNAQICFGGFRPHSDFNPSLGSCGYVLGGHRRDRGVFIRNFRSCCRRRAAKAWGFPNSCRSCMEVRGQAAPWSTWSSCSRTCGAGTQTRKRICNTRVCLGMRGRFDSQSRPCSWQTCCPVDGGWSSWTDSTECTASCGPGFQFRFRKCSSPAPSCGGKRCEGTSRLFRDCIGQSCPAAEWGQWAPQGPCSATCGNGTFLRYRECYRPRGDVCEGPHEDHLPCNDGPCPHIPPEWCAWNDWSSCSSSCSDKVGTRKRTRVCACPAPSDSTEQCDGRVDEIDQCNPADPCPMDGSWGNWMSWSRCNAIPCSIAKGNQVRMRLCVDPPPKNGGRLCLGRFQDRRNCLNMDNCFVEGTYGDWSPWQQCSVTCGKCSKRSRTRRCISPFVNPEIWEVDIVHGRPRLLCRNDRMQQTIPCHLLDCPDGTNPCKPASSPAKADSVEPQSGQSTEVNGDAEMVPTSTRTVSATTTFRSATQVSTSSTHAPQADAEMESNSLKVTDHVPTLSARPSTRNSDSAVSTGAGVVLEAESDALLSVTSHGSNKLVTSFPLGSLKTKVNVDFAHSVDKDIPRIPPEALTETIGLTSANTRNERVSISQRQLTSEEFSRSSKDSSELQTETDPSTLPVDSVRERIRTIATERSESRVTTVPNLFGERTKTLRNESVTKYLVRATEYTTKLTVISTASDKSQQVRPTGQTTTVLLESTEKQPMSSSTQSVKDLESLMSTDVLTKQNSTVLPASISKETKTASRQVSEKRDSTVIRDFANEQKTENKQITTTSPDRSKDQVVTPASVLTVETAHGVLPDLTLLNVEIAPLSSALIEKEIMTFSDRKNAQTAIPLRTLTEKSANDSVDEQTKGSHDVVNEQTTVSQDSVEEQVTVSRDIVDEQTTVSRDVVDKQTPVLQDVVNEQATASRDVVHKQITVSQVVVNEEKAVSRDVVDEHTTVSQDVVNEQTTVSHDSVDEQATVSQDVVNKETTVSRDVVNEQATVSQDVVNEQTTVSHDSVDEQATVSQDVVNKETTVSRDVVNEQATVSQDVVIEQTTVSRDVVNKQTTVSRDVVDEQTTVSQHVLNEQTTVSRDVVDEQTTVSQDVVNEETTVSRDVVNEQTSVSQDVVIEQTTVSHDVVDKRTTVSQDVVGKQTTVSHDVVDEQTTVSRDVVRKQTTVSRDVVDKQTTVSHDSVDEQATVSQDVVNKETTVSRDVVNEQATVSQDVVIEQTTVSRDVVNKQTTVSHDVVDEQTTVSRDVVDEQTTVSQHVVNEQTTVSRDVVDEQTTVSQDVVNEETTVSRDVVNEQTSVSQDVVIEQTTVSSDVVDKRTTVSQDVVGKQTTVSHDVVDEQTTVSRDVVRKQTTVSRDVVDKQTTVSRDVVDEQTVVLQHVVNEQMTVSQESLHEQTAVPYDSVDEQQTISRDSLNNAEATDFLKSVAKSRANSKPGLFDLFQDDVAVTINAWNKPTKDLQDLIDKQTTVSTDYITNPSTFSPDSVKTQATVPPILVNKQTTVSHDSVDQQSTVSHDSVKTRAAAARDSAKEQTTISTNEWNRSTRDLQDLVDEQTIFSFESARKSSTVSPDSVKTQATVPPVLVNKQTTVSDDSVDDHTTVSHGSMDEQTTVSHDSMDEQTTVSHDSMDEQTTVSHDSMDEQTTASHGSLGQKVIVSLTSADRHTAGSPISLKTTFSLDSIKEQTTISTDLWNKPTKDLQDLVDEQTTVSSESMRKSSTVSRGSVKTQTTAAQRSIKEQTTISTDLWNKPTRYLQDLVDEQPTMPTNLISKQTKISKNSVYRKTTGSPLSLQADSVKELRNVSNNLIEKLLSPFLDSAKEPTTSSPGSNIEQAGTSDGAKEEEQTDDDPELKKTRTTISSSSTTERADAPFDFENERKASSRFTSATDDASQSNAVSQDDLKDATWGRAKTLYVTYVSVVSYAVRVPETKLSDFLNAARSTGSNFLHISSDPAWFATVGKPKVAANYTTMRVTSTPEAATAVVQSLMRLDSSLGTKKKTDATVFDKPGGPTEFKNSAVAIDLTQPLSIDSRAQEPEASHLGRKTPAQTEFTALESGQSLHFAAKTSDATSRGTAWDGDVSRFAEKNPAFAIDTAEASSFDTASNNTRDDGINGQLSVSRLISALYSTKRKSLETAGSGDLSVQESAVQQQIKSLPAALSREHQTAFLVEASGTVQVNVSQQLVQEQLQPADAALSSSRKENSLQSDLSISMPQKDKLKVGTMRGETSTFPAGEAEVQPAFETLKSVGTHGHLGAKGSELNKLHYIYDILLPSSNSDPGNSDFEVLDGGNSGAGSETTSDQSQEHPDYGGEDNHPYRASDNPPNHVDDPSSNNYPDNTGFEVLDRDHSGAGSETTSDESQEHPDYGGEDYHQYRASDYPLNYLSNDYASGDYVPENRDESDESVLRNKEIRKVDNCAELDNNDVTPQIEGCCRLVNNTQLEERSEEYLECMGLLFEKRFNVSPDFDVENSFDPRTAVSRCVCRKQKQLLKAVCCYKPFCRQWPKKLFRSLCNVCQPHCPPCFKPLLSG